MQHDQFLYEGGGEMGHRTRAFDWASTPLGPIAKWPLALRNAVNIVLSSRFPMFIWWGPELIQFYNDAYRPSMGNTGKHPTALGQRGEECWPEIWPVIFPQIRQVMEEGISCWYEDQLIPIYRNGRLEDVYWTYSYSGILGDGGSIDGVLVVCSENTGKVLAYERLRESEDNLHFTIEATELGIWDYNPATGKFGGNSRLKNWFGVGADDEIDLSLAIEAIVAADRSRVVRAIQRALQYESGGLYDIKYTIISKTDGVERIVRAKGRAWFNEEMRAYRFNGTLQDITEQETAHLKLQDEVALRTMELRRSNDDLLQFAHVISHDLKEPVRKIGIFSHRVVDEFAEQLPARALKYMNKILHASDRMRSMIEGVLNYAAASSDGVALIDLNETLREVCGDLELVIEQKGARVEVAELPAIAGVEVLIHQLFYNVINNALKFTRPGEPPVIKVKAEPAELAVTESVPAFVRIIVRDNGIGFRTDQAEAIFDSFTRLHSKDVFEGTGLGLALAKKIVERHGGTIHATGEPEVGASFVITLPVAVQTCD